MKFERHLFNLLEIVPFVPVKTFLRNKNSNAGHLVPYKTFSRNKTITSHKPLPSHKLPSITKNRAEHDKRTRRGAQIISKKSYFTYPLVTFRTRSG